jgi:hypothetical protein
VDQVVEHLPSKNKAKDSTLNDISNALSKNCKTLILSVKYVLKKENMLPSQYSIHIDYPLSEMIGIIAYT